MKNIYVLPTDKRSKLFFNHNKGFEKYQFSKEPFINGLTNTTNQNIYITSDEKITNCDCYVINVVGEISRRTVFKPIKVTEDIVRKEPLITYPNGGWCKKIILTTDQDLIKNGVQAIDDEFLEWFVKNPNCEEVEVESKITKDGVWTDLKGYVELPTTHSIIHKIIIPKEELSIKLHKGEIVDESYPKEFKQETLEEAAEKYVNINVAKNAAKLMYKEHFIQGAKWQQERMYREEEVHHIIQMYSIENYDIGYNISYDEWFEQFKKK